MNLDEIKDEVCPDCGARATEDGKISQHSNGHWFEQRRFACGLTLKYQAGIHTIVRLGMCQRSKEFRDCRKKQVEAVEKLVAFVENLDVDSFFKSRIYFPTPVSDCGGGVSDGKEVHTR